jgi:hypothetical protein
VFGFNNEAGQTDYATYLSLLGGGLSSMSQLIAGSQTASLLRANANVAGLQAQSTIQAGSQNAEIMRQRLNQTLGRQQAQIGGAGLTQSGSALRALQNTAMFGAQDIQRTQLDAARKAWGFQVSAIGDEQRATLASNQGKFGALGSLITSGARAYGQWSQD